MLPVSRKYNQNWIPELFNDFFTDDWVDRTGNSTPAINVIENEHGFELELAAPGMTKEDFKVSLDEEGDLVINMEKKEENKENKENKEGKRHGRYLRREFSYAKFQQTMILPEDADKENISASVENGVLKVNIPKLEVKEIPQTRKMIEIK
ncbi:MAG: Hsp20/alpha crystallin family protein [Bacteroidales bacterium]|jgi:HSP20 family protein|nr:Hsp20/alpha crystallin family protein [Bacteroidales bacterium]